MSLRDINIGVRLIVGFGVVLTIMVVIAASGFYGMRGMNKSMTQIHIENDAKVRNANLAYENLNNIMWAMRLVPYASGTEKLHAIQKQIGESRTAYKTAMDELDKLETNSDGKTIIATIKATLGEAVQTNNQVMQLSQDGKPEDALALQKSKADPLTLKIKEGFESLLKYEESLSSKKFDEAQSAYFSDKMIMIALLVTALLICIVNAVALTKGITSPLNEAVSFARSVAAGDLTARCNYNANDEPGRMVASLNIMAENLGTLVTRITDVSGTVSAASTQLRSTAVQIATGTEQVANQTGTVAVASEQMSATSGDIAQNCLLASETCDRVGNTANESAAIVHKSILSMKRIADRVKHTALSIDSLGMRSNEIGEIVGTIEDIADQTNLLALNAAIEAARAGEQGRGFAVVADEVRALAERTTKATREISEMIKAIQNETKAAVAAMEEGVAEVEHGQQASEKSGEALEEILKQINEITMQVSQIATAAEEQTAATQEIAGNIQQVTEVIQDTARGAEETSSAAHELAQQSVTMQSLISQFKLT
ncbi:MAG: methyl-accepting chemotaxis protein [Oryzomonas sp.]|uniref:methyl-accepting chemotaxis protein n=1 Tax=Oryzomonas sp. TaxID=2855186 RepID=UPI0028462702|nr:methyl-accepting chemotaxis protein [Oryzomonas sp.]MDR3581365.1 methyl-accepting chemotaxis protein [Oryzomonas sp.]